MLNLWQHLVLVANGNIAYQGGIFESARYSTDLGYRLSALARANPVEFSLSLLGKPSSTSHLISQWAACDDKARYTIGSSNHHQSNVGFHETITALDDIFDANDTTMSSHRRQTIPFSRQCTVLIHRHGLYTLYMLHGVTGMILRNVLGGAFYGLLYYRNGTHLWDLRFLIDPRTQSLSVWVYNVTSICFSVPLFVMMVNCVPIPAMFAMKRYCDKEQVRICF